MAKTIDAIVADVRMTLRDDVAVGIDNDFSDDQLKTVIEDALIEVSDVSPYEVVETALTTENSKLLDISAIGNLLEIDRVEYPVGNSPRSYRNFERIDNETIEVDMASAFSETGAAGTLAGTVTFTSGSATVTGSGTAFTTALEAGYFIKRSGGTRWYRVYSIESNTSLTLEETVKSGDTGADTINITQYRSYVARLYCWKKHNLTLTSSTLNAKEERALILGSAVKAASTWLNEGRWKLQEAANRVADVNTAIDDVSARITQALADLEDGRTYINKINIGGRPQTDYSASAARELSTANTHLNQASGYTREISSQLNISRAMSGLQAVIDRQKLEYRGALKTIIKRKIAYSYSRA